MDSQLIFWIAAAIVSIIAFAVLNVIAARETQNYVKWVAEHEYS